MHDIDRFWIFPPNPETCLDLFSIAEGGPAGASGHPDINAVVLGLQTLGSFDFEGHSLLQFVQHCATHYLHSEEKLIRFEAVKTCSSLLKGTLDGLAGRKSQTVMATINEVLAKLLKVSTNCHLTKTESRFRRG